MHHKITLYDIQLLHNMIGESKQNRLSKKKSGKNNNNNKNENNDIMKQVTLYIFIVNS